jgi:hypothetical protein
MKNLIPVLVIGGLVVVGVFAYLQMNKNGLTTNNNVVSNLLGKKEIRVGNDVCGEFNKEFIEQVTGKKIVKTTRFDMTGTHVCDYFLNNDDFLSIHAENLSVAVQKKGQMEMGRTITTNPKINMEHFIAVQPDGLINTIYLVINPNFFVTVDRSSGKAATEAEIVELAVKVVERIQKGENVGTSPESSPTTISSPTTAPTVTKNPVVPLPQEQDIVRSFFGAIDEGRPSDAAKMMNTTDDSTLQAWAVQFNAFKSVKVKSIESSMPEEWTSDTHTYKVILDVVMKPEAANVQPIPNYGFDNGENYRWVSLKKIGNLWKIQGLSTGP